VPLEHLTDVVGAMSQRADERGIRLALEFIPERASPT